jgi:hypothetical protein
MGQFDLAWSFLANAEAIAESTPEPDPVFVQRLLFARGYLEVNDGQLAKGLDDLSRAQALARQLGDIPGQVAATTFCAMAFSLLGACERVERAAAEVAMRPEATLWIDWSKWFVCAARRETHGGKRAREAIAGWRSLLGRQDTYLVACARAGIALGLATTGDLDEAEREATDLLAQQQVSTAQAGALAALALVALRRGRPADALALAERGIAAVTSGNRWLTTESVLNLVRAEALEGLEKKDEARTTIRGARDRVMGIAATLEDPELRASYLTSIDANARTIALAREWLGEEAAP